VTAYAADLGAEPLLSAGAGERRHDDDPDRVRREDHDDVHRVRREQPVRLLSPAELPGDDQADDRGESRLEGESEPRHGAARDGAETG
jgi:hypothetical protein